MEVSRFGNLIVSFEVLRRVMDFDGFRDCKWFCLKKNICYGGFSCFTAVSSSSLVAFFMILVVIFSLRG